MLTTEDRAAIRKMARETEFRDSPLTEFDRNLIGNPSVRVNVPLRDAQELAVHLRYLSEAVERGRAILSYQGKDQRAAILAVRGLLRQAHKKMNIYRPLLVALADDGTIWLGNISLSDPINPEWVQVPPIPQDAAS